MPAPPPPVSLAAGNPPTASSPPPLWTGPELPAIAPPLPTVPQSPTTSGVAIASLVCSCTGLLLGFLGAIPGIILGLKALRQIKTRPGLGGKGLAMAGLITGSALALIWIPLTFILVVATISGFRAVKALDLRPVPGQTSGETAPDDVTTDLTPDPEGWKPDLVGTSLPDTPVAGRLQGLPFTPADIALHCDPASDLEFSYQLSTPTREELLDLYVEFDQQNAAKYSNHTINVNRDGKVTVEPPEGWGQRPPRFRMVWSDPGPRPFRERVHDAQGAYPCAMRLEFGQLQNARIPGRIYLCLFDRKKSFLRGKFLATVSQSRLAEDDAAPGAKSRPDEPPSDTNPDAAGWTLDLSSATIPATAASGRVHGAAFKLDRAFFEGPRLKLRQGLAFFPEREFEILIWEAAADPGKLAGRTVEVLSSATGPKPNVRVCWMERGQPLPESLNANVYAMKLELGELRNGRLSGRIYLCVADHEKSFVRGKFVVSAPQFPRAPALSTPPVRRALPQRFPPPPPPAPPPSPGAR